MLNFRNGSFYSTLWFLSSNNQNIMSKEIKSKFFDKEFNQFSETPQGCKFCDINYCTDYERIDFTGLFDNSEPKKEIYENDIFEVVFGNFDSSIPQIKTNGRVIFKWGGYYLEFLHPETRKLTYTFLYDFLKNGQKKVIGNWLLNPELYHFVIP